MLAKHSLRVLSLLRDTLDIICIIREAIISAVTKVNIVIDRAHFVNEDCIHLDSRHADCRSTIGGLFTMVTFVLHPTIHQFFRQLYSFLRNYSSLLRPIYAFAFKIFLQVRNWLELHSELFLHLT